VPDNSVALLMWHLGRVRRRLTAIALARYGAIIASLCIVAGEAAFMAVPAGSGGRPYWALSAALATAVACVTAVVLRSPTLAATATIVDRRWNLLDRATTALELADQSDTVSNLVLADAVARLAEHSPHELRYEPVHRLPAAVTVVGVVSILLLIRGGSTNTVPSASRPAEGSGPGVTAAPSGRPRQERAQAQAATTASRSTGAVASRQADVSQPEGPRERAGEVGAGEPVQRLTSGETGAPHEGNTPASGVRALAGHTDAARPEPGAGISRGAGPGGDRDAPSAEQRSSGASGSGRGGSSRAEAEAARVAGGAQGGQLRGSAAGPGSAAPGGSAGFAARYRSAAKQVESAIEQERIPAQRRTYVRDYFLAIRPVEQP
jgi:hypothetical protein